MVYTRGKGQRSFQGFPLTGKLQGPRVLQSREKKRRKMQMRGIYVALEIAQASSSC